MPLPTRVFKAYGLRIALHAPTVATLDAICAAVPYGWQPAAGDGSDVEYVLRCSTATTHLTYHLSCDSEPIAQTSDWGVMLETFTRHAELLTATLARDGLFVHAGVVGWQGQAILIPGRSFSGKTTLVKALVEIGAVYYSDEFAILDRQGLVHPYALPLSLRDTTGQAAGKLPLAAFGGQVGVHPLPVGLVAVTQYEAGAKWRPRPLSAAQALLALMDNTVAAQREPSFSMPILRATVLGAKRIQSKRGEADRVARAILRQLIGGSSH